MSNKIRISVYVVFLSAAIIFALANDGWRETWWMLLIFLSIPPLYEVINYFVIRKRLKQ